MVMTAPRRSLKPILALLPVLAALAAPGLAEAKTFCVATACPADGVPKGFALQGAISDAEASPGPDTILLGAKSDGSPFVGPFTANAGVANPERIDIVGAPGDRLTITAGETAGFAVSLRKGSLRGADVKIPPNPTTTPAAVRLGDGAHLEDVSVPDRAFTAQATVGVLVTGFASAKDVSVKIPGSADRAIEVNGSGSLSASGLRLTATSGLFVRGNAVVSVTGSRISGTRGINQAGGIVFVTRSVIVADAGVAAADVADGDLSLTHVTLVAQRGSDQSGLKLGSFQRDPNITLESVVLAGFARSIRRFTANGHVAHVSAARSVWNDDNDDAGPITEKLNSHAEPGLADPAAGDFRPAAGSTAIDRDLTSEGFDYSDVDGIAAVDGDGDGLVRADAGALEYRRQAPKFTTFRVPARGTAGARLTFQAAAADPDGDPVRFGWSFGDGTGTALGGSATHVFAKPGTYKVRATLLDILNVEVVRTATVVIVPRAARPRPVDDRIAPTVRARLSAKRIRTRARARKLTVKLALSEPATVRITATRAGKGRRLKRAVVRRAPAGRSKVRIARLVRRVKGFRRGRVVLRVRATDAAGNASRVRRLVLRVG